MESRKVGPWKVCTIYIYIYRVYFSGHYFSTFCFLKVEILDFRILDDYLVGLVMWLSASGIQFLLDGEWSFCLSPFFGHELDNLFGKLKVESGKWKAKNGKWKVDLTPILLSKSRKSTVFSTKLQRSPSISTVLAWLCSLRPMDEEQAFWTCFFKR